MGISEQREEVERNVSDIEQIMRAERQRLAASARREAKSSRGLAVMHIVGAALTIPVIVFSAVTESPWVALLWVVVGGCWTWTATMYRKAARSWIATAETWEGIDRPAD